MVFKNSDKAALAILAFAAATDFASTAMAKMIGGETGIDSARLPTCMALPGSGSAAQLIFPSSLIAAEVMSENDQSCRAVLQRAGFEIK